MNNAPKELLKVTNLKKYFPVHKGIFRKQVGWIKAVDGIDFTIHEGEVLALVGESGSGKSTAARAAMRLTKPTSGEILFCGNDFLQAPQSQLQKLRREMQMIFQDPFASLNPRKTVAESLGESLVYHGYVKNSIERDQEVLNILEHIGLPSASLNRYPHEFSGGQQQRLCIGRALALKPKLIICDEAVSALDVSIQAQILNLLLDLKVEYGLSYLFISHDLSVVRHICDRVMVMKQGKIVESGDNKTLFTQPKDPYTKALLASIPIEHPKDRINLS